jgi:hypothetical protein
MSCHVATSAVVRRIRESHIREEQESRPHLLPRWVKSSSACQAAAARPDDHLDGAAGGTSALLSQPDDVAPIMGMLGTTAEVTAASRSRFSRQAVIGRLVPLGCQDSAYSCDLGRWARRGCGA